MRKLVGLVALLAIVASPAVAQARVVCRYTGVEITDCEEQRVPDQAVLQQEGCCERRVVPPLGAARITSEQPTRAPAIVLVDAAPRRHAGPAQPPADAPRPATTSGPPLYVVQRALLI